MKKIKIKTPNRSAEKATEASVDYPEKTVGAPLVENPKMSVRNLDVSYSSKQAIYDVTLDIGKHELIALIGPSGCGKSTLLNTCIGLLYYYYGS